MQKKYQKTAGTSIKAGLIYNAFLGLFSAGMFLVINKFEINISLFSILMASIFSIVLMLYVVIGFQIMEKGNMSLYTLFLMSGGMTVPYIWGVLFLNEEITIIRTIGLAVIIAAIVIYNSGVKMPNKKQLILCLAVFLLNGISSVVSKMHQINPVSKTVTSSDFVFITAVLKAVICSVIMIAGRGKLSKNPVRIELRKVIPIILLAASVDGVSFMLQLIGASNLPATVLYPLVTGGSLMLTSLVGVIVFKEKLSARQWAGIAVCFVGTLLFL